MRRPLLLSGLLILACCCAATAEVTRLEITSREPYANGRAFGEVGPYEHWRGKVYFAVDPRQAANRQIIDVELAPRNKQGLVEFSADLDILAPKDLSKSNGAILYDVNNRGNRISLGQFNGGTSGFLFEQGYINVSSGWIAELLPGNNRLRLFAPVATENGRPITGVVRAEMAPNSPAQKLTISHFGNHGSYRPIDPSKATLTWRLREKDARVPIPHEQWQLIETPVEVDGQTSALPLIELQLSGGFRSGYLYELIYEARDPIVQGLGLAGIRDLLSFLKYDTSERNPLRKNQGGSWAEVAYGFGVSQSGRCLRLFVYDGFNADEQGRQVFDAIIPHVAGGGLGFFNHRFASPTRHNTQHDNHLYWADVFPFAYDDQRDPYTGRVEGILTRARASGTVPKVMHTQSSSEYWNRSGSLVHTDPLAQRDANVPSEVRIYTFGGTQHGAGNGMPGKAGPGQLPRNPADYRAFLRGLLVALDQWVRHDKSPPPSAYPTLADGTLVGWREAESGWRALPGIRYPEVIQQPEYLDRGPEFLAHRRTAIEPPVSRGNYRVKVPAYDADDLERGTLQLPDLAVPVATYTSWNLRNAATGAEGELLSLNGGYIPLARTAKERKERGDPRLALIERYENFDEYLEHYAAAIDVLIEQRYLLAEDRPRLLKLADQRRALFEP